MQSPGVPFLGSEQSQEAGSGPGGTKEHIQLCIGYSETPTLPQIRALITSRQLTVH